MAIARKPAARGAKKVGGAAKAGKAAGARTGKPGKPGKAVGARAGKPKAAWAGKAKGAAWGAKPEGAAWAGRPKGAGAATRKAAVPKRPPKAKSARGSIRGTLRGGAEGALQKKALRPKAPADQAVAAPARPAQDARPDPSRPRAVAVAQAALDKKAEDVLVLDVRGLTSYADYFVVVTADSERQASAIADHVDQEMKKQGTTRVGSEGYESGRWILIDFGDVVAHVMSREARGFYDLEGLWADAPRVALAG